MWCNVLVGDLRQYIQAVDVRQYILIVDLKINMTLLTVIIDVRVNETKFIDSYCKSI